jgi:FtsZ-binding cell division protein ZapB
MGGLKQKAGEIEQKHNLPCNEPCAKCRSNDIYRKFYAIGDIRETEFSCKRVPKFADKISSFRFRATEDHIIHHCRCCQYTWETEPLKDETIIETTQCLHCAEIDRLKEEYHRLKAENAEIKAENKRLHERCCELADMTQPPGMRITSRPT